MPTFKDIETFIPISSSEIQDDMKFQVSANQSITLQQIAYRTLKHTKPLTLTAGSKKVVYDANSEKQLDLTLADLGAAAQVHTHPYTQVLGNDLSILLNNGVSKLGIRNYSGGEVSSELSTANILAFTNSSIGTLPDCSILAYEAAINPVLTISNQTARVLLTNQELILEVTGSIGVVTESLKDFIPGQYRTVTSSLKPSLENGNIITDNLIRISNLYGKLLDDRGGSTLINHCISTDIYPLDLTYPVFLVVTTKPTFYKSSLNYYIGVIRNYHMYVGRDEYLEGMDPYFNNIILDLLPNKIITHLRIPISEYIFFEE